jgi:hypothetical protein
LTRGVLETALMGCYNFERQACRRKTVQMSDVIQALLRIESRSRKNGDAMKHLLLTILICGLLLLAAQRSWARKWSDATGKFSVEAELVEVKAGKVVLRKAGGSEITVSVELGAR